MAEIITAAQAPMRSTPGHDYDTHIERIMQQIRFACMDRERKVSCYLRDCTTDALEQVCLMLKDVGYSVEYSLHSGGTWITVEW